MAPDTLPSPIPFDQWPPAAQRRLWHAVTHCDALARTGTGARVCDAPLDAHATCPRAATHQ